MSKEYEISTEDFTYLIEASPVIEDEDFDQEFGIENIEGCTGVKIDSVVKICRESGIQFDIDIQEFKGEIVVYNELKNLVSKDYNRGVFND